MTLKKITKEEFEKLQYNWQKNYFANGAIWDEKTDNLIAFPKYTQIEDEEVEEFYKIIEKSIDKQ